MRRYSEVVKIFGKNRDESSIAGDPLPRTNKAVHSRRLLDRRHCTRPIQVILSDLPVVKSMRARFV